MLKTKMKLCPGPTCLGTPRPVSEFYRNRARPDGLASQCRHCQREFTGRPHVRERLNAQERERIATNPEHAAANSARAAEWQRANPEAAHAIAKRYRDSAKGTETVRRYRGKLPRHEGDS